MLAFKYAPPGYEYEICQFKAPVDKFIWLITYLTPTIEK